MRLSQYCKRSTRRAGRYDNASSWKAKLNNFKGFMMFLIEILWWMQVNMGVCVCVCAFTDAERE